MIHRLFARRRAVRDFALAIRPELIELRTPEADEQLLARILVSRQAGVRVILPRVDSPPRSRTPLYGGALAAGIALAVLVGRSLVSNESADRAWSSTESWFGGRPVYAQSARVQAFAPVFALVPGRIRPLALQYRVTSRDARGELTSSTELGIGLDRTTSGGIPAWRVSSTARDSSVTRRLAVDTAYLAAADLRLLASAIHEAPYRSYTRIDVTQKVEDSRLFAEMTAERDGRLSAHRTVDRRLEATLRPYVAAPFVPLALMGISLSEGWRGSLSVLGWAIRDDDVIHRLDLRVEREEHVRVPAGEFACWRIAVASTGRRFTYWVRRADGVGIRSLDSSDVQRTGVRELVLTGETNPAH
jgi:hypothetical protein